MSLGLQCQAAEVVAIDLCKAAAHGYDDQLLRVLVGDLKYSVSVRIRNDINQSRADGRLKTDKHLGCIAVDVCELESEEIAFAPIMCKCA